LCHLTAASVAGFLFVGLGLIMFNILHHIIHIVALQQHSTPSRIPNQQSYRHQNHTPIQGLRLQKFNASSNLFND
jgi:hypothetical protein